MSEEETAQELAENLNEDIDDDAVDIDVDELEERFEQYMEYNVDAESARQTILRNLASAEGLEVSEIMAGGEGGGGGLVDLEEIDEPDQFVTVEVEVTELWDNDSDAISQVGLVHDNTDRIKFKAWSTSEVPLLTEGQAYRLESVATDEYQGRMEISLNSSTEIEMIDESFEAPDNTEEFTGALVKMHQGSGLIRRCTEDNCNRVLENGECQVHGEVEGEFDLRLRAVADNGDSTMNVNIGRELTEKLTGMPIEEAKSMAQDALDTAVVGDEMSDRVLGRYYELEGWVSDRGTLIVQEADEVEELAEYDVSELIVRVDALESNEFEQGEIEN